MTDANAYGLISDEEYNASINPLFETPGYDLCTACGIIMKVNADGSDDHFCKETVSSDMEKVFRAVAKMQEKIERIDETITKATAIMQHISDTIGPIIDKLSKNPILKNFL